jgi:hypothetical protein
MLEETRQEKVKRATEQLQVSGRPKGIKTPAHAQIAARMQGE